MNKPDFIEKVELVDLESHPFFDLANPPFDIESHTIYSVISGSRAYGTNVATSDVDIRGVVIPPLRYFTGLGTVHQIENQSKDICYYTLRRFFELAYKNNVHALEMLFMHPDTVNFIKPPIQQVLDNRKMFLSKNIAFSFAGYAHQQILQMDLKKVNNTGRVELIEKHGYDTKMFMHAVRLYRMGAEALLTGELTVKRPDAAELLEIRDGKYSFEEAVQLEKQKVEFIEKNGIQRKKKKVIVTGGFIKNEADKFAEAYANSKLPPLPNFQKIEALLMAVHSKIAWLQ
jgi:predicted nucleotidyltransferase